MRPTDQGTNVTLVDHTDHVIVYADNCCLCRVIYGRYKLTGEPEAGGVC